MNDSVNEHRRERTAQERERRGIVGGRVALWAGGVVVLVVLLLLVSFLESLPALKPVFTTQGAFFVRLFIVVSWALVLFYYNDRRR